ncbi:MAG: hypothetical protein L6V88_06000 [Anaerotruncus sp.]|nr:MAG: hypothetical protein L6V88_06000 [Anaerotruncus sp.]
MIVIVKKTILIPMMSKNLAEIFFSLMKKIKVLSQLPFDTEDNILAVTEMSADEIRVEARVFEKK